MTGTLASVALLAVYLGVISIAQGPSHALEQLAADAWFVMPSRQVSASRSGSSPSSGPSAGVIALVPR